MKRLALILVMVAVLLVVAVPAFAAEEHTCDHEAVTVESLHHCVMHAAEMGHITSAGVATSLLAKVEAAQAAVDRGDTVAAVYVLRSFIYEVKAQAGKAIDAEHAGHLVMHAENVIAALVG